VHEFGHFIVAKKSGVRVDEFGIGYPPKAMKIAKIGETEYTLNWLPFGGFVRLFGEERDEDGKISEEDKNHSLEYKAPWKKILILFAGAFFNFLFGWFLFSYVYFSGVPLFWDKDYVQNANLTIAGTVEGSPASVSGIQQGDIIKEIYLRKDPKQKPRLLSPDFVANFISKYPGETIVIKYKNKNSNLLQTVKITPVQGIIESSPATPAIGVNMTLVSTKKYSVLDSLWLGLKSSVRVSIDVFKGLGHLLKSAFEFNMDLKNVAGPVGIASMVGDAASVGFAYLLYFTALISVNLAVINLIPIPALDGGRILFTLIEVITGGKKWPRLENAVNLIGFGALILLMIVITYHDILKLIS